MLGLLLERPSHGYRLQQRFEELVGDGWRLAGPQVYGVLAWLENAGLVEVVPSKPETPPQRGPKRTVYRATREAPAAFEQWFAQEVRTEPVRLDLHVKIVVGGPERAETLLELIDDFERKVLLELEQRSSHPLRATSSWASLARDVVDDAAVSRLQADLSWAQRTRSRIRELATQFPPPA
jgi:DNA-binding PadR family transcriptional regulator